MRNTTLVVVALILTQPLGLVDSADLYLGLDRDGRVALAAGGDLTGPKLAKAIRAHTYRRSLPLGPDVVAYLYESPTGSVAVVAPTPGSPNRYQLPSGPNVTFYTYDGKQLKAGALVPNTVIYAASSNNFAWLSRRIALTRLFGKEVAVTGAAVDENAATVVIHASPRVSAQHGVDTGTQEEPLHSLSAGLRAAATYLEAGRGVRIRLAPGVYRDTFGTLDSAGWPANARAALLVIEAPNGPAIISGADDWSRGWTPVRGHPGVYSREWPYKWGLGKQNWDYSLVLASITSRSEVLSVNGTNLTPIDIEEHEWYDPDGPPSRYAPPGKLGIPGKWQFKEYHGPKLLKPGTFGVSERNDTLFVRLPDGVTMEDARIEVSVRKALLRIVNHENIVLRNLHFIQNAGFIMGGPPAVALAGKNLQIEDCRFDSNSAKGLTIGPYCYDVTLRRCAFNHNGWKGLGIGGASDNILLEDCESSYNNWRGHLGGHHGWDAAAVKSFQVNSQIGIKIVRHRSFANLAHGFWLDHSFTPKGKVEILDSVFADNAYGAQLYLEKLTGPILVKRCVLWGGDASNTVIDGSSWNVTIEDSILYTSAKNSAILRMTGRTNSEYANWSKNWTLRRNLLVADAKGAVFIRKQHRGLSNTSYNTCLETFDAAQNIYVGETKKAFDGRNGKRVDWNAWKKQTSQDDDSSWCRNPFVDAAHFDWNFKPDSEAAKKLSDLPKSLPPDVRARMARNVEPAEADSTSLGDTAADN